MTVKTTTPGVAGERRDEGPQAQGPSPNKERGRKTYKPDSVPQKSYPLCMDDHFSGIRVASNLKRPTRRPRPGQPVYNSPRGALHMSSYLALHQATLTVPVMSPPPRWALTPPFHPYLSRSDQMGSRRVGHRRFDFCGAGVGLLRLGVTQRPAHGVRTFLSIPKHRATIQSSTHASSV